MYPRYRSSYVRLRHLPDHQHEACSQEAIRRILLKDQKQYLSLLHLNASVTSQGAVIPTRPASEAFKHMETSGLPYLIHVNIIHVTVATAGATVVVRKIEPNLQLLLLLHPLNPYQPNHQNKYTKCTKWNIVSWESIYL